MIAKAFTHVLVLVLGLLMGLAAGSIAAQPPSWWFTPSVPVAVHQGPGLDYPKVRDVGAGEAIMLYQGYQQADDLIWSPILGGTGYAAVARYGYCEIRSFGSYEPSDAGPISGVDTERD